MPLSAAARSREPSEVLLRAIHDVVPAYIAYVDTELRYVAANRMYLERFGRAESEIVGRLVEEVTGSAFENVAPYLRAALAGEEQSLEPRMNSVLGERILCVHHLPHRDESGRVIGVVVYGYDVTERRRAEAALLESEKLAAVGRLASSVAHEINNPLESLTNLLYLARTSSDPGDVQRYLLTAEQELRRAAEITTRTLKFHRQLTNATEFEAGELFDSVLETLQARVQNAGVTVERRYGARVRVRAYEGEIRQVLINLIGNAVDAMPGGGVLRLGSRAVTEGRAGQCGVRFTVADTGAGIPPEFLRRIFQPFQSTKGIGGTGLGLWVSREIVERHRGSLRVRSRCGAGTVFAVFLPSAGS